jgi:hypothetical protein
LTLATLILAVLTTAEAAPSSATRDLLVPIIALVFGSGGVAAFFLIRPQAGALIGQSAKAITEAAAELVAPLRAELSEERKINAELRERLSKVEEQLAVVHGLERDRDSLAVRVKQLEKCMTDAGIEVPAPLNIWYHEDTDLHRRRTAERSSEEDH